MNDSRQVVNYLARLLCGLCVAANVGYNVHSSFLGWVTNRRAKAKRDRRGATFVRRLGHRRISVFVTAAHTRRLTFVLGGLQQIRRSGIGFFATVTVDARRFGSVVASGLDLTRVRFIRLGILPYGVRHFLKNVGTSGLTTATRRYQCNRAANVKRAIRRAFVFGMTTNDRTTVALIRMMTHFISILGVRRRFRSIFFGQRRNE